MKMKKKKKVRNRLIIKIEKYILLYIINHNNYHYCKIKYK